MFRVCLTLFQICGFHPVKVRNLDSLSNFKVTNTKKQQNRLPLCLWSMLHFIIVMSFILFMIINQEEMLYAETPIGKINDVLIYFSLSFAHLAIVIESFIKRRFLEKFWNCYEKVLKIEKRRKKQKWRKSLSIKMIIFSIFNVATEIFVITNISSDSQWTNFWYAEVFSLVMTRFRHLQHIFFIDILFFTLQDMNCRLRNTLRWTKAVGGEKKFANKFLYASLSQIKEELRNLMDMVICVNKVFCWSQVLNVGQHFLEVTVELYWVYAFAKGPKFLWRK